MLVVLLKVELLVHGKENSCGNDLDPQGLFGRELHGAVEVRLAKARAYVQEGRLIGNEPVVLGLPRELGEAGLVGATGVLDGLVEVLEEREEGGKCALNN